MTSYRKDIDGLRAFAVLAVIVNHADPGALASGFLGVDVFFVISGYVIALSLMGSAQQPLGSFLHGFYTRRVKRLMPALILCVAVSSTVLVTVDPDPDVSLSTAAAALFGLANIHLYIQQLDYFATDTGFNAFTHMWSLGIEEQFYLVLPVLFWWGLREPTLTRLLWIVALLSVLSFAAFVVLREAQPVASFYLLHTRFWELGAGVFLALLTASRPTPSPGPATGWLGWWIGWQGLFLLGLLGGMALAEPDGRIVTAVTVVLTMMMIAAPDRSWLLDNPVTVYLGRISYTLYLWHWPLLVFDRLAPDAAWTSPAALIGMLFGASILSYHLVEQPLRHQAWSPGRRRDLVYGLGVSGLVAVGLVLAPDIRPQSATGDARALALEVNSLPLPSGAAHDPTCVVDDDLRLLEKTTYEDCTFPPESGSDAPTIWTMGDSHAGHFQGLLVQLHQEIGIGFHLVETVGQFFPPHAQNDPTSRLALLDRMREDMRPGDIVFLGRLYLTRSFPPQVAPDVMEDWIPALESFLREMEDRSVRVIIAGPPPIYDFADIRACDRQDPKVCAVPRAEIASPISEVETALQRLAGSHDNLRILSIFDLLCPERQESCSPALNGAFTMRDSDHLNVHGASLLKERFLDIIDHWRGGW